MYYYSHRGKRITLSRRALNDSQNERYPNPRLFYNLIRHKYIDVRVYGGSPVFVCPREHRRGFTTARVTSRRHTRGRPPCLSLPVSRERDAFTYRFTDLIKEYI